MGDKPSIPVFSGAELALADALILIMKVMAMHGVIDANGIKAVFDDLEGRYKDQQLASAAAMAAYLRLHSTGADEDVSLMRLRSLIDRSPEGSA